MDGGLTMKYIARVGTGLAAIVLLTVLSASVSHPVAEAADTASSDETIVELRIWLHVNDAEDVWVSARPQGGDWDTVGTIPLEFDGSAGGYLFRTGDFAVAGVEVRIWQSTDDPERISVRACGAACPEQDPRNPNFWTPVGMLPQPLDDGFSRSGRYRYGNLVVAIPPGNPGLLADREYLLVSREALEGHGEAVLNWSPGTPVAEWDGVVVEGTPPRVTKLLLSDRGLKGEVWGWIGDLTELTELRLDGNNLRGMTPSKLSQLAKLTHLYFGESVPGRCIPPRLRLVPNNDIPSSKRDCPVPPVVSDYYFAGAVGVGGAGTYQIDLGFAPVIFDVAISWLQVGDVLHDSSAGHVPGARPIERLYGYRLHFANSWDWDRRVWLFINPRTGAEYDRFDNRGVAHRTSATDLNRLAASIWVDTTGVLETWE